KHGTCEREPRCNFHAAYTSRSVTIELPSSRRLGRMPDEDRRFFHRADPPHSTPSAEFEFIMEQLARIPTRRELVTYAFVILFTGAVLGIVATEAFWRYLPMCSFNPTSPLPVAW